MVRVIIRIINPGAFIPKKRLVFMVIKVVLLLLFFAVTIFVGFYFRKRASSVNDFVLGGREIGPWLSAFAFGTSYFSAVVFIGYAGQFGWRFGTSAIWIALWNALFGSLAPWFILGRRTRVMTLHLKSSTMPEFFGSRFNSPALKISASIIVFIFLIPYTASLYNGLSRLFAMAFGIDFIYCIIGMAVLTGIYVVAGGYVATAVNDFIQGIIMLVGISAVVLAVFKDNGGFVMALTSLAKVEEVNINGVPTPGILTSFFGPDPITVLGVAFLTSLGIWGLPQMVSKFYSIKSEKDISKGAIISTIFAFVVSGGCYVTGSFGRLYGNVVERTSGGVIYDSVIPKMLEKFPDALIGLVVLLVLSASMSTLSALVMASSSTLTLDCLKGHIIKKMDDKKQLLIVRALIVVFIIISVIIAVLQYKKGIMFIAQLMGISWGALAGSFFAPFVFGLYWKRVSNLAVWCSFIFGTGLMTLNIFFRSSFPALMQSPINAGCVALIVGVIIVPVISMFSKAPDKAIVDNCFSCYKETASGNL